MGGALIPIRWDGYKNLAKTIEEYSVRADMQPIPIMVMNGFGFMFKRQLIKEIGVFDHVNFHLGTARLLPETPASCSMISWCYFAIAIVIVYLMAMAIATAIAIATATAITTTTRTNIQFFL